MKIIELLEDNKLINDRSRLFPPEDTALAENQAKTIPFLQSIPEPALSDLMEKAKKRSYDKNTLIIPKGSEVIALYIVLSGKVRVSSSNDANNKEFTLLIQEAGSCFGETALLTNEPELVSVSTLEDTVCAVLSKEDFLVWLERHPEAAIILLSVLSLRIIQLTDKVRQMALMNVYERTVKVLKDLAVEEDGHKVIHNRPSQQFLASMVGASREMVSKIIADLTKGGYVEMEADTLTINKKLPTAW